MKLYSRISPRAKLNPIFDLDTSSIPLQSFVFVGKRGVFSPSLLYHTPLVLGVEPSSLVWVGSPLWLFTPTFFFSVPWSVLDPLVKCLN
jgi:hypothetical protein